MYAIKIGLWARDTYEGLKMFANNVSNNCYDTFEIPLGTNYQVPSGKILRCSFIRYEQALALFQTYSYLFIGYGDDAVDNSGSPPINPVILTPNINSGNAFEECKKDIWIEIPSQKYPFIFASQGALNISVFGYEEE